MSDPTDKKPPSLGLAVAAFALGAAMVLVVMDDDLADDLADDELDDDDDDDADDEENYE
ncbi:MAG: hypothetical protein V3V08_23160 [Nannocystaceae bacterium]